MKLVAINGSPRGKSSNTEVMLDSFLDGARETGAETVEIILAEKKIEPCRGCYSCWTSSPGRCTIRDDCAGALSALQGADVIALATPLYFNNISGTLKAFVDRFTSISNPHAEKAASQRIRPVPPPRLVMISNCGFPERSQFDVVSLWIRHMGRLMGVEVAAEIYATRGKLFRESVKRPAVIEYLRAVRTCGREVMAEGRISEPTAQIVRHGC
jgi:FMN-dependent NADH-azoreductase